MSDRIYIAYGNKKSTEFDITVASDGINMPQPEQKRIEATVPFMNGYYDFSYMNGHATYEPREVTVKFNISGTCEKDMLFKKVAVLDWLKGYHGQDLYISGMDCYIQQATMVAAEFEITSRRTATLSVTFKAHPFLLSGDWSDSAWDTVSFEKDCLNADTIAVTAKPPAQYSEYAEVHIFNYADYPITPRASYGGYRHYPGLVSLSVNGVAYYPTYFYHDSDTWFNANFVLQPGDNVVKVLGWGTLTFDLREECL